MSKTSEKVPSESIEQIAFVSWFRATFPSVKIAAIPNGGYRHPATAQRLKAEGASPGVPDLMIPEWRLWIEFKRRKGGRLSPDQKDWRDYLINECGDSWIMAKGAEEAVKLTLAFARSMGYNAK